MSNFPNGSAILRAVRRQPEAVPALTVSIVGAGNLGTVLAMALPGAGYKVQCIATRNKRTAQPRTKALARKLKARLVELGKEPLHTDLVWITVPDDYITQVARKLADVQDWRGKIVFHSSGALTSDELAPLRLRGARVASVHPMMTFVRGSVPKMAEAVFALEGDSVATRVAREIAKRLGGDAFLIHKQNKVLYHAFGSFASPLVIALMASLEQVALAAGVRKQRIKPVMVPLLRQTLCNYLRQDAASAFSGPLARGDVATLRKHLRELKSVPEAREVYLALAKSAVKSLPVRNRKAVERELQSLEW
jgi:predicted short-subunit dehydrogenase-like oxidoreductase (DUF2520 family)